jgi:antimicrobial peptide system SdpB family protein
MTWIAELRRRWVSAADATEPRGPALAVGRVLLALAQLATLAFNSDGVLFAQPDGMRCDGLGALSMWCLVQGTNHGLLVIRIVSISVLLVVLSGYRPRLTCVPHWYVAFGMIIAMPVANGGDRALQVATLLLIPVCLGDDRTW